MKLWKIVRFLTLSKGAKALRKKPVRKAAASFVKSYALWKYIRRK